jgi:hypothetical protein
MAHRSHLTAIANILEHDQVKIEKLEYRAIPFKEAESFYSFICYFHQRYSILAEVVKSGENRILFLSYCSSLLWILKKYRGHFGLFKKLNFLIVLHGSFENIRNPDNREDQETSSVPLKPIQNSRKSFRSKLRKALSTKPRALIIKIIEIFLRNLKRGTTKWPKISERLFNEKQIVETGNVGFRYLALAPYITENAYKFLDRKKVDIRWVFLPTIFSKMENKLRNKNLKIAVFGYGNSKRLSEVSAYLFDLKKDFNFEIRIVGMDSRGTEGYPFISVPDHGPLKRDRMEFLVRDIDFFLILYERNRYRLSCSGSVFEALSYRKPIIHLDNECVNFFNSDLNPIGIKCDSTREVARTISELADKFEQSESMIATFLNNINLLRHQVCIENNFKRLTDAFSI